MAKKLRFAALIRVSTEKQDKQGESCRTQSTFIQHVVKVFGGEIVVSYQGREHATPSQERAIFNRMLEDAQKPRRSFDAIIVSHHSRWSRNNIDSKRGIELLRRCGVRLFVGMTEFDLDDYNARFILGIQTEIGEREAAEKKWESIENRIHRAKRGIPTGGKLPFGRDFDKVKGEWVIIPRKKAMVEDCAKRYLDRESMSELAMEYGINHSSLHKTLTSRCGTDWEIEFKVDDLKVHEVVKFSIPPLLPAKIIKAIQQRVEANKTYRHGRPKHPYLLSGLVFCSHCGYAMFGQTNHNGHRYYRHAHTERARHCSLTPRPWVRCDELEDAVLLHVLDCFGNPKLVQKAIEDATPNKQRVDEVREQQKSIDKQLARFKAARGKVMRMTEDDLVPEDEIRDKLAKLKEREEAFLKHRDRLQSELEHIPSPDVVAATAKRVAAKYDYGDAKLASSMREALELDKLTWKQKRELAEDVFDGLTAAGRPMGVYLEPVKGQTNHRHKRWKFTLHGKVVEGDQLVTPSAWH